MSDDFKTTLTIVIGAVIVLVTFMASISLDVINKRQYQLDCIKNGGTMAPAIEGRYDTIVCTALI